MSWNYAGYWLIGLPQGNWEIRGKHHFCFTDGETLMRSDKGPRANGIRLPGSHPSPPSSQSNSSFRPHWSWSPPRLRPASAFCLTRDSETQDCVCVAALYTLPTQTKIASWALCVHGARGMGRDPEERETVVNLTCSSNDFFVCFWGSVSLYSSSWPRTYYIGLAGLECSIHLPWPPEHWGYRHMVSHMTASLALIFYSSQHLGI